VPDRNSLLLPQPAQRGPDAPAAMLPGPDVAAVCASGLRRGLLLPLDLVALRESWRAEALAGARPARARGERCMIGTRAGCWVQAAYKARLLLAQARSRACMRRRPGLASLLPSTTARPPSM